MIQSAAMNTSPRIVFMGTPEFAVPVLACSHRKLSRCCRLYAADKPAGRSRQVAESPVKAFALEHNLPLEQPRTLRNVGEQNRCARLRAGPADRSGCMV